MKATLSTRTVTLVTSNNLTDLIKKNALRVVYLQLYSLVL